jgi:FKBP-type peptidyl-prolyl cis-trans isomerase FklB
MKLIAPVLVSLGLICSNAYALDNSTTQTTGENPQMQSDAINRTEGETFLTENKQKPGVVTLPSGLQYKVITEGKGEQPTASDTVTVNYSGKLINGTEFDSSFKRGEPATFPVGGVIRGWTEALKLMKVGATWELYIPAALAYGARGVPPIIGPNQVLIFTVDLLGIKKA